MNDKENTNENDIEIVTEEEEINKEYEKYNQLSKEELICTIIELNKDILNLKDDAIKLKDEKDDWQEKYTRLQAEFENTQKRWEKSRDHLKNQSKGTILRSFLPLYDSFKNALKNEDDNGIIQQFFKQFMNILKAFGIEPMKVEKLELFDYNKHEALTTVGRDDVPNNTIIDIIQDGIIIDKDILRYAKVIVSRIPKPPKQKIDEKKEEKLLDENTIENGKEK